MKIIWANRSEWRKPGPIVYIGLLNALSFAQAGYQSHFFVSEGSPSDSLADLSDFYGVENHEKLHIHRIAKGSQLTETLGRSIYRQALNFARQELEQGEKVTFLTRELGLIALLSRLQKRFPDTLRTLYEAHDFHADLSARDHKIKFTDHRKRWTERFFLPRLSGVLCITPPQEALYRQALPKVNTHALPLGCLEHAALSLQEVETRRKRRTVVYVGHLHRYKGVHDLLEQANFFQQHQLELHLLGGQTTQIAKLEKKLRKQQTKLSTAPLPIRFFPAMPPVQLHRHLEKYASIGIVPLQDSYYNRALTCPVKALDSLSHHLPVIASDLPTTRAVLADAAIYLPPQDSSHFSQVAKNLIDDPQHYQELAQNAAIRAAQLAWNKRAQAILDWSW
ncbi:MAG: glycosyltransferase [Verrucomicrobiales bacterium]|nr:glycosyltransferase [Verrucomicrobiales bacterium]